MTIKIYHQVGHFANWNLDSFEKDQCGNGLILSPMHQRKEKISALSSSLKGRSIFDPQYYLPNSPKAKLASYPFFPGQIGNGFSTADFPLIALESATQCVDFQIAEGFEGIVVPARFMDQMASRFFERQEEYTVLPFLKAIEKASSSKPIYLTLPLTSAMLLDQEFRVKLLNWVTGFQEVSGVYLLVNDERSTKQIQSVEYLAALLSFAQELFASDLVPILGHQNTESLLFSLIGNGILTFGSFENTRMFSMDKFIESDEERRAPKARIYLPALLNWIQFDQAMQIRNDLPEVWELIYRPTSYADAAIESISEPYFNQPGLYKHHFICLNEQIRELSSTDVGGRYERLRESIRTAISLHRRIEGAHLDLDPHGNGDHLQPWLDSINTFYRTYLRA